VRLMERYRHGAGGVTSLARYLRGGPIKNARLGAYDGARITCTCRARAEEPPSGSPLRQRMTFATGDFLPRWLLHVPAPSGRNTARATVGGEFPTGTLSVVPRVPSSPLVHVSVSPPLIPDGRISRVRLAVSDLHA